MQAKATSISTAAIEVARDRLAGSCCETYYLRTYLFIFTF